MRAWACVRTRAVLAQARARDREPPRSALHGVPVGIKDVIDTRDLPTAHGSPIHAGRQPRRDAACVARLRDAGAVILGKTETVEFAAFHWSRTRNPLDLARTPGGSSSGSGAAVADGMVPLALGTQTGGSTLRPAAYCGVVGYKPSYGWADFSGIGALAPSQDTLGFFARSVTEVATFASITAGRPLEARAGRRPRVGLCALGQWPVQAEPAMAAALDRAAARLSHAGAKVSDVVLPPPFADLFRAQRVVNDYEAWRALGRERRHHRRELSSTLRARLDEAGLRTGAEYRAAQRTIVRYRPRLRDVFRDWDVLLLPVAPGEAPLGERNTGDASYLRVWTALHNPTLSLPVFEGPAGMPMGLQLVGARGADAQLLASAEWIYRRLA